MLLSLLPPSQMVAPKCRIANFNFVSPFMSTKHTNEHLTDSADDLPQGRPPSHPSIGGPRSTSPSPMDSSLPLEVNYAECVLAQNSMDIKLDITPNLIDQCLWADQTDDRATFSQSNVPLNQNKVITPAPATHSTSTNLAMNPTNLEPFVILYQANQPVDLIL